MNAKDKAKELFDKYLPIVRHSGLYDTYHNKAKNCAIIAVDEIFKTINCLRDDYLDNIYWAEVKKEIELL